MHRMRLKNRQSSASESTKGDSTVDQEKTSSDGMDEIAKYIKSRYVLFFFFSRPGVCPYFIKREASTQMSAKTVPRREASQQDRGET